MERRNFARHDMALPVRIESGSGVLDSESLNISGSGLAIKLESAQLTEGRVKVTIGELGEFAADVVAGGAMGRLRLDISEADQAKLADDLVAKLAHLMPV